MQAYSNPERADDPHALPNIEVFQADFCDACGACAVDELVEHAEDCDTYPRIIARGWYWWSCFPGCLPDGDPIGPFASEADALADAQGGE